MDSRVAAAGTELQTAAGFALDVPRCTFRQGLSLYLLCEHPGGPSTLFPFYWSLIAGCRPLFQRPNCQPHRKRIEWVRPRDPGSCNLAGCREVEVWRARPFVIQSSRKL